MNKKLKEKYRVDLSFEPREMICKDSLNSVGCKCFVTSRRLDRSHPFTAIHASGSLDTYKYAEDLPDYEPPLKMGDKIEAGSGFNETIFIKHGSDDSVIAIASKDISKYENGQAFNTVCTCYWRRIKPIKITLNINGEDKEWSELSEKEKEYIKKKL